MSDRSSMAVTWTMPSSSLDEIGLGNPSRNPSASTGSASESQFLEGQTNRIFRFITMCLGSRWTVFWGDLEVGTMIGFSGVPRFKMPDGSLKDWPDVTFEVGCDPDRAFWDVKRGSLAAGRCHEISSPTELSVRPTSGRMERRSFWPSNGQCI